MFLKKQWSTAEASLEIDANIRGDQLIIHHKKNFKNIQVNRLIVGGSITNFTTSIKHQFEEQYSTTNRHREKYTVDYATYMIIPTTSYQQYNTIMEENVTIKEEPTSLEMTDLFNARCHRFQSKIVSLHIIMTCKNLLCTSNLQTLAIMVIPHKKLQ